MRIRIGISNGPIVAGVIGPKRFSYDLWGETVNLACRLESLGEPGGIQVSEPAFERLRHKYHLHRKTLEMNGQGNVAVYELASRI